MGNTFVQLFCSHISDSSEVSKEENIMAVTTEIAQAMKEYQAGILADYVPYTPLTAQNLRKLAGVKPNTSLLCTAQLSRATVPAHSMT